MVASNVYSSVGVVIVIKICSTPRLLPQLNCPPRKSGILRSKQQYITRKQKVSRRIKRIHLSVWLPPIVIFDLSQMAGVVSKAGSGHRIRRVAIVMPWWFLKGSEKAVADLQPWTELVDPLIREKLQYCGPIAAWQNNNWRPIFSFHQNRECSQRRLVQDHKGDLFFFPQLLPCDQSILENRFRYRWLVGHYLLVLRTKPEVINRSLVSDKH